MPHYLCLMPHGLVAYISSSDLPCLVSHGLMGYISLPMPFVSWQEFKTELVLLSMGFLGPEETVVRGMGLMADNRGNIKVIHTRVHTRARNHARTVGNGAAWRRGAAWCSLRRRRAAWGGVGWRGVVWGGMGGCGAARCGTVRRAAAPHGTNAQAPYGQYETNLKGVFAAGDCRRCVRACVRGE